MGLAGTGQGPLLGVWHSQPIEMFRLINRRIFYFLFFQGLTIAPLGSREKLKKLIS